MGPQAIYLFTPTAGLYNDAHFCTIDYTPKGHIMYHDPRNQSHILLIKSSVPRPK